MILRNTFHDTAYHTSLNRDEVDYIAHQAATDPRSLEPSEMDFVRTVRKVLCGMDDCRCSRNPLGERND
jgi:hypothetical protein